MEDSNPNDNKTGLTSSTQQSTNEGDKSSKSNPADATEKSKTVFVYEEKVKKEQDDSDDGFSETSDLDDGKCAKDRVMSEERGMPKNKAKGDGKPPLKM